MLFVIRPSKSILKLCKDYLSAKTDEARARSDLAHAEIVDIGCQRRAAQSAAVARHRTEQQLMDLAVAWLTAMREHFGAPSGADAWPAQSAHCPNGEECADAHGGGG